MTDRAALLDALLADPSRASEVPRAEAVALLVEMARVERALELALTVPAPIEEIAATPNPRLLTIAEAAERSRKTARWLREHVRTQRIPFVRKGRSVLFPEAEFDRWLRR